VEKGRENNAAYPLAFGKEKSLDEAFGNKGIFPEKLGREGCSGRKLQGDSKPQKRGPLYSKSFVNLMPGRKEWQGEKSELKKLRRGHNLRHREHWPFASTSCGARWERKAK